MLSICEDLDVLLVQMLQARAIIGRYKISIQMVINVEEKKPRVLSLTNDRIRLSPFLIADQFNTYLVCGNTMRKIDSLFQTILLCLC